MSDQGVNNIKRISFKRNENIIQTNTYILTFERQELPRIIKLFQRHSELVEEYKERPQHRNKCQSFTHIAKYCRDTTNTCGRCGTEGHQKNVCPNAVKCFHCNQPLYANDRSCPKYLIETEILATQIKKKTLRIEARFKIMELHPKYDTLYSSVVAGRERSDAQRVGEEERRNPSTRKARDNLVQQSAENVGIEISQRNEVTCVELEKNRDTVDKQAVEEGKPKEHVERKLLVEKQ